MSNIKATIDQLNSYWPESTIKAIPQGDRLMVAMTRQVGKETHRSSYRVRLDDNGNLTARMARGLFNAIWAELHKKPLHEMPKHMQDNFRAYCASLMCGPYQSTGE